MKIPSGYWEGGFGQRAPVVVPALNPTFTPETGGDQSIGAGGVALGNNLLNIVTQQEEFKGQLAIMDAQEAKHERERVLREQEAELKQMNNLREVSEAKSKYLNFDNQLTAAQQAIIDDPDIPPEEYPAKLREVGDRMKTDVLGKLNERQQLHISNDLDHRINLGADALFKHGKQEIYDSAWASDLEALANLKNDPTRPARDKIAVIKDVNFFSETGRPEHEIEAKRQQAIQEIIAEDAAHKFNSIKPDTKSKDPIKNALQGLNIFRQEITATDANGQYTYMPEWDIKTREQYVSMLLEKKQTLEAQAAQIQREQVAAAKQEATNMVMEYKDRVKTGWVPTTAADFKFQATVRSYASLSPSLARQYEEASSYTTDMDKRLKMKKEDPLGVAAAERGVQIRPLDLMNRDTLPQQISERLATANQLGVKAVFKGPEIEALSEYLKTLPARDQGKLISAISKPLGPAMSAATFNAAAEQVKVKDPGLAITFKLVAQGKPAEAELYTAGRGYLTGEKKDFLKDKFTIVQQEINDQLNKKLGTALAAMPEARNSTREAVATVYLAESQRRNLPLDKLDKDLLEDVTARVAGKTVSTGSYYGSNKTTIIPDGMKPDQFSNSIKAITAADIDKRGGVQGMSSAEAATFLKKSAWHEWGNGYMFQKDGKTLFGANGKPFIFRFGE